MKKRYAFWRDEKGSPYRKEDNKNTPSAILAAWGEATKIDAEGKLSWDAFSVLQFEGSLKMVFVIEEAKGEELDETDAWSIAKKALHFLAKKYGGGKAINSDDFLAVADAAALEFIRSNSKPYVLLTSLSLAPSGWRSVRIGNCIIAPIKDWGKFRLPQAIDSLPIDSHIKRHLANTKYQWITISTIGRSIHEAVRRATEALSLLRAIATLAYDSARFRVHFGRNVPKPLSTIHSGPVYTLHDPNGVPVGEDIYWIERFRIEDQQLFAPSGGIQNMLSVLRARIRRISRLPYRSDIEQLLLRYISALDNTDHDLAFLQMWSILEKITDTIGGRYDDAIRRATWWFRDRAIAKERLECVRIQRNRFVHTARTSGESDQGAYLIKSLIEPHLISLVNHAFSVPTLKEYAEIIDQPVDPATLTTLKRRLKFAERIHGVVKKSHVARSVKPNSTA